MSRRRRSRGRKVARNPPRRGAMPRIPLRRAASTIRDDGEDAGGAAADLRPPDGGRYAISSMVLYGLARLSAMSSLITGQAGSNSPLPLSRQLNFGLRGYPWWLLC